MNSETQGNANATAPNDADSSLSDILKLIKHIFLGVVLFLALGIPAIALDFLTQGVALLKINVALTIAPPDRGPSEGAKQGSVEVQARTVAVSAPVRYALTAFEMLLLVVDVLCAGGYIVSKLVRYMRSLQWH